VWGWGGRAGQGGVGVPDQILIAFVANLTRYGFWWRMDLFPEFWKILENGGVTELIAARIVGARRAGESGHRLRPWRQKGKSRAGSNGRCRWTSVADASGSEEGSV
jgi:hypothetical protein